MIHRPFPIASPRRRQLLQAGAWLGLAALAGPLAAAGLRERRLRLVNLHTGDGADVVYWRNGRWRDAALERINWVLRDHRSGAVSVMDRPLLDLLHALHVELGAVEPFGIVSGYRSPATNDMLRRSGSGVARRSLHSEGRAADLRLAGWTSAELRDAARRLRLGGVGHYPRSGFIHVDTGRVRYW